MRVTTCLVLIVVGSARAADPIEDAKRDAAILRAKVLEQASKKYYLEKNEWPTKLADLAPLLEKGKKGLVDPWGKEYQFEVRETKGSDGEIIQRPFVWTERKVDGKIKVYGQKPPEEKKKP